MRIATLNVNGIRSALKKDFYKWLVDFDIDIIGIQETKIQEKETKDIFGEKYHSYWHFAEKAGYSGVATISKVPAKFCNCGMDNNKYDVEGRVLETEYENFTIINVYIPSGTMGEHRHQYKLEFLQDFGNFIKTKRANSKPLIILGDYNIVHQGLDIHNPERKDNPSGYRPDERQWLSEWFDNGFTDAFRMLYPDKKQFSWWSYRAGAFKRNLGWRIDYISVSKEIEDKIKGVQFYTDNMFSDHCPIILDIDL